MNKSQNKRQKRKNKRNKGTKDQVHQAQVEVHLILPLHNLKTTERSAIERDETVKRRATERISVPDQRIKKIRSKEAIHDKVRAMMIKTEARR